MDIPFEMTTPRLRLYAPALADVEALLRGERDELGARINATVSEEWWLGPSLIRLLPNLSETMRREPGDARWIWMVINPTSASVIGDIGFHGPLRDGATVEFGYSLVPEARGYGYATEACVAMIRWTFIHTKVAQVIAQIDPANAASLRVAAKLGMHELPPVSAGHRCFGMSREQAKQALSLC
jgi:ribosomal-protein-alanine N-acetyltransferase